MTHKCHISYSNIIIISVVIFHSFDFLLRIVRKNNRVTRINLVKSPLSNTSIYRFEWIPGRLGEWFLNIQHIVRINVLISYTDRLTDCRISTHSGNPHFGCTFNSNSSSSMNSPKLCDDEKRMKNSPTKLFPYCETTNNLLQNNKFYTAVNVQFHKSSQKVFIKIL